MKTSNIKKEPIILFKWRNKLSTRAFCKLCKISVPTYRKIISGEGDVTFTSIIKVAQTIGLQFFDMLNLPLE